MKFLQTEKYYLLSDFIYEHNEVDTFTHRDLTDWLESRMGRPHKVNGLPGIHRTYYSSYLNKFIRLKWLEAIKIRTARGHLLGFRVMRLPPQQKPVKIEEKPVTEKKPMPMLSLTNEELAVMIRALSFYGKDMAENGANTEDVWKLVWEFSHSVEEKKND